MGAPPQPCAPSVHNQKRRRRCDDDGDAPVLGLKEGSCLMGRSPQQKRKRNDDDDYDSKDSPFSKRTRFQPPISRSSESSTAPPSKDGLLPAPATAPPSKDGPSPAPATASSSKDGPGLAPAPRIVAVNREEDDDLELVTLVELELELSEPLDRMVFYNKRHRAAVLRYRFAETILKARDEHTDEGKLKEFKRQVLEEIFALVSEARRREKHKRKKEMEMEMEEDPELLNILTKMKRLRTTAG